MALKKVSSMKLKKNKNMMRKRLMMKTKKRKMKAVVKILLSRMPCLNEEGYRQLII